MLKRGMSGRDRPTGRIPHGEGNSTKRASNGLEHERAGPQVTRMPQDNLVCLGEPRLYEFRYDMKHINE